MNTIYDEFHANKKKDLNHSKTRLKIYLTKN